jgi:DeoR/GlpR family transcriptional regulator of sugar metabolism
MRSARTTNILAAERRFKIQELLARQHAVTIAELVNLFGTSEMTIRRDLDELEKRGVCQRTYGGAISLRINDYQAAGVGYPPFSSRERAYAPEKVAIARQAAKLVRPGDVIALDSGTTASFLAWELRGVGPITVITNSIGVMAQLCDVTSISLISLGGTLSLEGSFVPGGDMSFVGPVAVATLRKFRPNKAFIGTSGLSVTEGIFNAGLFQAEIKRTMIEVAEEAILITDHSKFGQASGFIVTNMGSFSKIITDTGAPQDAVEALRAMGLEVILVEPEHDIVTLRPFLSTTGLPESDLLPVRDNAAARRHHVTTSGF